jgi:RHS repeat-associated protein
VQLAAGQPSNLVAGSTWYLNGEDSLGLTYEKFQSSVTGQWEHRHYLSAGGMVFALHTTRTNVTGTGTVTGVTTLRYFHHDHLGSIAAISNETGQVVERLAYDPWGKRRFPNGLPDGQDAIVGLNTERGYTLHEHLDEVGVIHMNGRIFDPLIGRFMSADPYIQAPGNLQSFNRYAYVMNNPLAYTDPSGYWSLRKSWKKLFKNKVFRAVAAIAVGYFTGGALMNAIIPASFGAPSAALAAIGGAGGGLVGGAISGDSSKAALQGMFSGGLFGFIGGSAAQGGWSDAARIGAHGAAGCVTSAAAGGSCGAGAASAAFGKFATLNGPGWTQDPQSFGQFAAGITYTAVSGGIGSVLAGGKFANGAETAAYGYLFNHMSARGLRDFFRSVSAAGHHFVPYVVSAEAGVSMDAAREFSKAGTGIIPDYGNSDNPHRGHTKAHAEYDKAVRSELDSYLKSQDTTASKMTTDQAKEFVQRIRTSQVPEIKNFNMAIRAHILNNALKLAPPRGD